MNTEQEQEQEDDMGYRYEVQVSGKWYDNKVIFATTREAQAAADNKLFNWTQAQDVRVIATDDAVNYRFDFDCGAVIHIPTETAPDQQG
jgi:hypothetical protein